MLLPSFILASAIYTHALPNLSNDNNNSASLEVTQISSDLTGLKENPELVFSDETDDSAVAVGKEKSEFELSADMGNDCSSDPQAKQICRSRSSQDKPEQSFYPDYQPSVRFRPALFSEIDRYKCKSETDQGYLVCDSGESRDRFRLSSGLYDLRFCQRGNFIFYWERVPI